MRRTWVHACRFGFIVAWGGAVLTGSAVQADVVAHNGSAFSDPPPAASVLGEFGPEEVDVDLYAEPDFQFVDKFYNERATLQLEYLFEADQPPVSTLETVFNDTDVVWISFVINLEFARFTPSDEDLILPDGELQIGVDIEASSNVASIVHTSFATGAEFELTFTVGGLAPGDFFDLRYYIARLTGAPQVPLEGFAMQETPFVVVIPVCGNGVLESGEECDDGSESATCDADCTFRVCGDNTVNTTAGEQCDSGGESAACDADCTLVECGDGLVNTTAGEECDGADDAACPGRCQSNCTCAPLGIPTVTEWGLVVMSLLGLTAGTLVFGRSRAAEEV